MVVALRVASSWALACSRISRNVTMLRMAMTVRQLPRTSSSSGRPVVPETVGMRLAIMEGVCLRDFISVVPLMLFPMGHGYFTAFNQWTCRVDWPMYRSQAQKRPAKHAGLLLLSPILEHVDRVIDDYTVFIGVLIQRTVAVCATVGCPLQAHREVFGLAALNHVFEVDVAFPVLGILALSAVPRGITTAVGIDLGQVQFTP